MITIDTTTQCWLWQGKPTKQGYGQIYRNRKNQKAHRYVYEQLKGPIKPGYDLHHLCNNRLCVNPDHLQVLSKEDHQALHPKKGAITRTSPRCAVCGLEQFICDAMTAARGTVCTTSSL